MQTIPTKEELRDFLKTHRSEFPRKDVAKFLGVELQHLNNCFSKKGMPESMRYEIAKHVGIIKEEVPQVRIPVPNAVMVVEPSKEEFTEWNKAALKSGQLVEEWCISELNKRAEQLLRERYGIEVMPTPVKKQVSMAAEEPAEYGKKSAEVQNIIDPEEIERKNAGSGNSTSESNGTGK